jgi:hypothetical protein
MFSFKIKFPVSNIQAQKIDDRLSIAEGKAANKSFYVKSLQNYYEGKRGNSKHQKSP